jgi:ABC-type nitrate/sulfonate/bicarbonate transport system ATPase subunit
MTTLRFEDVSFGYERDKPVIENASFEIRAEDKECGHVVAIMGSSGSGKSTLLRLAAGLEQPDQGQVTTGPTYPVRSYVPQDSVLFEHLSRIGNARYFEHINAYKGKFDEELFKEVRETLGLGRVLEEQLEVGSMSGGERQRLSLLRSLSIRPDLLLMDEPCTGLDAHVKLDFLQKLRRIVSRQPMLVLYVTHHPSEALLIADEIVYILKQESSHPVSSIIRDSVRKFVERPAALEAARLFSDAPLNVLICKKLDSKTLEIVSDSSSGKGQNLKADEVYLAFKPAVIQAGNQGLPVVRIGRTPIYTYVTIPNGSALVLVLNTEKENGEATAMKISLKGPALMYGPQGMDVETVSINSQTEGSECRRIYLSS